MLTTSTRSSWLTKLYHGLYHWEKGSGRCSPATSHKREFRARTWALPHPLGFTDLHFQNLKILGVAQDIEVVERLSTWRTHMKIYSMNLENQFWKKTTKTRNNTTHKTQDKNKHNCGNRYCIGYNIGWVRGSYWAVGQPFNSSKPP